MPGRRALAALLVVACGQGMLRAQQKTAAAPPATVRILATGSFLGQFDGMFEYPSHSADPNGAGLTPYGGLLGVETWLKAPGNRRPGDLLVIAGDNPSHAFGDYLADRYGAGPARTEQLTVAYRSTDEFFKRLGQLRPAAIGLWSEDFFRALAPSPASKGRKFQSNAGRFAAWLADNPTRTPGLPTLASNAAIRIHAAGLNTVDTGAIELEVPDDQSVPWTDKLTLSVPCEIEDLKYELTAGSHHETAFVEVKGDDNCHAGIDLAEALKPGRRYTLAVTAAVNQTVTMQFSTDRALTPSRDGLPVVDPGPGSPLIVGFVDPGIRAHLPREFWEWKPSPVPSQELACATDHAMNGVTLEKCEIVLLDPKSVFGTIAAWFAPKRERYFALLSGLSDDDSRAILNATDLIKFAVLPNDTELLGRGALAAKGFSGSDGNVAILDAGDDPAARIWARPEWIGETVVTMEANVVQAAKEWHLTSPEAEAIAIKGRRLCAVARGNEVVYYAATHGTLDAALVRDAGAPFEISREYLYPAYVADRTYDGRNKQGKLWINRGEFASMVLDRMRGGMRAEVAIMPTETVDNDYIAYFAAEHEAGNALDWLSRETLRRALFRAGRIVRVRLSGKDLLKALQDMTARAKSEGKSLCVAGIGNPACGVSRIDRDHLLINGRTIVGEHFYGVAMPAGLAGRFDLKSDTGGMDLVELVNEAFIRTTADFNTCDVPESRKTQKAVHADVEPLGERLERAVAQRVQPYVRFAPLDFTLANVELDEPERGSFSQTTIEGRDAKDRRTIAVATALDMGLDWRRATLRGIGSIKQGRDRIEDPAKGTIIRSEDPDEYSIGARLDWKVKPFSPSLRLFAGGFVDGELIHDRFDVTPAPEGVRLRRYQYGTAGLEVDNLVARPHFKLSQVRLSLHAGRAYNERTRVKINDGDAVDLSRGLGAVLKGFAGTITKIEFEDVDGWRNRIELGTLVTIPFYKAFGRDAQLEASTKGRYVISNVSVDLAEKKGLRNIWKVLFPVNRLFSVGFEADHHLVWSEQDQRFSVWRTKALVSIPVFTKRAAGFIW